VSVKKDPEQVELLRKAGRLLSECLDILVANATPGRSGKFIDDLAEEFIRDHGALPAFKGYGAPGNPFPASVCFSVNEVVVHGVPTEACVIKEHDLITIDCGLSLDGWFADAARLFGVGELSADDALMLTHTEEALNAGIAACRAGQRLGDVCYAVQSSIVKGPYFSVDALCGHAIGQRMHESPQVPNFGRPGTGITLEPGMVFCIEPVLKKHRETELRLLPDDWTVVTHDGSRATHIEHMVLITDDQPEILSASIRS
jgi:methionyl aminopeptidase